MNTPSPAALALLCAALAAVPAWAASSASSAASDSVGTLSGSVSGSLNKSSNSSTKKDVAQGDYRVIEVAEVAGQPGMVRMTLQALADAGQDAELLLTLPQAAYERSGLGAGQVVTATPRPYGVEFARADSRQAFFLVLADHWLRELTSHPVVL